MRKCDIIIPVWNELESTRKCINSLRNNTRYPYRLIVVDNGSEKPVRIYLEGLKRHFHDYLLIRNNANLGFVKAINQGIVATQNHYISILNNDAYLKGTWLKSLVNTVESGPPNIGIANPTSNVFGKNSPDGEGVEFQELDSCRGFCMLIKREVINKIGLFDEIYGIGYFEEKDFSRRAIEAGYISVRSKASFVQHKDRLSFDKLKDRDKIFKRNEAIFNKKWGKPLSIAFVAKKENDLEKNKDLINKLLRKGHRINIFSIKQEYLKALKDHIEIRFILTGNLLFGYDVIFKLWKRRRKKKIEIIVTENEKFLRFFNKFKFIHKADVLRDSSDKIADFCEIKSRKLGKNGT